MEIYFDRRTAKILRYIRWHPQNTLAEIQEKLGEDANGMTLINLCSAGYLVCTHPDGSRTMFKDRAEWTTYAEDTFWISPKGRKILEDRFDRVWQWAIPILISTAALIISVLSALNPGVVRVILLQ